MAQHTTFEKIAHPSDFTETSQVAFVHALRLGVAAKASVKMVHVSPDNVRGRLREFPGVRDTLERWGMLPEGSSREAVASLGISLEKVVVAQPDPVDAIRRFLIKHGSSLIVLATHRRSMWFDSSRAVPISQGAAWSTLFIPDGSSGFVSSGTGAFTLRNIVLPVAEQPHPGRAFEAMAELVQLTGLSGITAHVLHVGTAATLPAIPRDLPSGLTLEVHLLSEGASPVDQIVKLTLAEQADLVVMPTAGRDGLMDVLRGSTVEQVLTRIECPLLAIPVVSGS